MRNPGYYWVKLECGWWVAEWSNNNWHVCGIEEPITDIIEVDENELIKI